MEAESICIYAKYGKCKKEECSFHHPQDICCDKTCDIYNCMKKHPQYCRYFWGFNACRNEESCKFRHNKADNLTNHTDVKKIEALEQKFDGLLSQFNHYKKVSESQDQTIAALKEQLEEQAIEIHNLSLECNVLRSYVLPEASQCESDFNDVSVVTDDKNDHQVMQVDNEAATLTTRQGSDDLIPPNPQDVQKSNKKILNIGFLEGEIVKIKNFITKERMVSKGINESRHQIKSLKDEMTSRLGNVGSEKILNDLETLHKKCMKTKTNYTKIIISEIEKFEETCRKEKIKIHVAPLNKKTLNKGN